MKKTIFDLAATLTAEETSQKKVLPASSLDEIHEQLYFVLNSFGGHKFWKDSLDEILRGFDKKLSTEMAQFSRSLFGFKMVERTLKYSLGTLMNPYTEERKQEIPSLFWIDIVECDEKYIGSDKNSTRTRFEKEILLLDIIRERRKFMEENKYNYIIHYDPHVIYDKLANYT